MIFDDPRIGDYVIVTERHSPDDSEIGTILRIVKLGNDTVNSDHTVSFYVEGQSHYYTVDQVDIVPEEIYNSPLFAAMKEK